MGFSAAACSFTIYRRLAIIMRPSFNIKLDREANINRYAQARSDSANSIAALIGQACDERHIPDLGSRAGMPGLGQLRTCQQKERPAWAV